MKIIVLDSLITSKDKKDNLNQNIEFLEQDISKSFEIGGNIDYIIHAASIASPPTYRKFPIKTVDVNYQGTKNKLIKIKYQKKKKYYIFFFGLNTTHILKWIQLKLKKKIKNNLL